MSVVQESGVLPQIEELESTPWMTKVRMAALISQREVIDSFRDWRIIIPIMILTLGLPIIMTFGANMMLSFVTEYGAEIIVEQLIPFLLLVVGFLPMTFSLVIALETFVGEKERKSLEPLLMTPLSNLQLYIGKMLAALFPPLIASYSGILIYLFGLWKTLEWRPSWDMFLLIFVLTTVQGILMVAMAVVISSQTTSVRASNLLASFVIIPMALLVQVEAVVIFWGDYKGLWGIVAGVIVAAVMFGRMGVQLFNREVLLGRSIDHIQVGWMWQLFWERFSGREDGRYPTPMGWYRGLGPVLKTLKLPILTAVISLFIAVLAGVYMAYELPFPESLQAKLSHANLAENVPYMQAAASGLPLYIFFHNIRVIALAVILGLVSFGVLALLVLMIPAAVVAYIGMQMMFAGEVVSAFLLATIIPHGVVEVSALVIAIAAALRWHTTIIAPPQGKTVGEAWMLAGADAARIFWGIVLPLLLLGALIEAFITPLVATAVYGSG